MPKETLTNRIERLEGCYGTLTDDIDELRKTVIDLDKYLHNGLGDKIAISVATAVQQHQSALWDREKEERKLQLEEQRVKNAEMGQEKDRKIKLWGAVISLLNGGFIITFLSYILSR